MATTRESDTKASSVETLPAKFYNKRFIPHPDLLPSMDIMITNAGFNGVLLVCLVLSNKVDANALFVRCSAGFDLKSKSNGPTETQIGDTVKTIR